MRAAAVNPDELIQKTCVKCGATKPVSEFYKQKNGKHGVRADCSACSRLKSKNFRANNPGYYVDYVSKNKEREQARFARYREQNREKVRAATKRSKAKNPGEGKRRYQKDPQAAREYNAAWRDGNREKARGYARKYMSKLRSTAKGKLIGLIRSGLRRGINGGAKQGRRTFELLGYTPEDLMSHMERQFKPGMSWENMGKGGWSIDHKIPLAAHNFETPDDLDFKRAWALENLQPLWEFDNLSKGAKLAAPFQPLLLLSEPAR